MATKEKKSSSCSGGAPKRARRQTGLSFASDVNLVFSDGFTSRGLEKAAALARALGVRRTHIFYSFLRSC